MTCPPSLQQQEGRATSSYQPLNLLASSGLQLQPPQPWGGEGRQWHTARLGTDSRQATNFFWGARESQSQEERMERTGEGWYEGNATHGCRKVDTFPLPLLF